MVINPRWSGQVDAMWNWEGGELGVARISVGVEDRSGRAEMLSANDGMADEEMDIIHSISTVLLLTER